VSLFSGVPAPLYDETLSSWLVRLARDGFIDDYLLHKFFEKYSGEVAGDLDALYRCPKFIENISRHISVGLKSGFRMPDLPLMPLHLSIHYCPACLEADIANNKAPGWRRSWRVLGACVCSLHSRPVLLQRVDRPRPSVFNKAWIAFDEFVRSPASHLDVNFAFYDGFTSNHALRNRFILRLTQRVQRWYQTTVCTGRDPRLSHRAAWFLLCLWLWEGGRFERAFGFARLYVKAPGLHIPNPAFDNPEKIHYLFHRASVQQVAVAYWLLGISQGIISEKEASYIKEVTYSPTMIFPTSLQEIRLESQRVFTVETLEVIRAKAKTFLGQPGRGQIDWVLR
jgi:hypothetical protein